MGLLTPSALLFGLLAIPIVALYLLRLKGRERRVSSTFLWRQVVHDIEANTLWQRLRPNILLLLQLLVLAALVLALSRPYFLRTTSIHGDLVLVLDASASMQAIDVDPNRFGEAQQRALRMVDQLPEGNLITLILMGDVPEIILAQSQDSGRVRRAISDARPATNGANMASALSLAASVVRGERPAQVVVFSDGNVTGLEPVGPLPFDLRYEIVGASQSNLGIAAFSIRHTEAGKEGLARVVNYGHEARSTSLHLYADESLYDVREFEVAGSGDQTLRWSSLPSAAVISVRLTPGDSFALDDQAWATGSSGRKARVLLVSNGNRFLEKALSLQPGLDLVRAAPDTFFYDGEYDLWVFDGFLPATLPVGAVLVLGPPVDSTAWVSSAPVPVETTRASGDEMLRYADLSSVHVREAVPLQLPPDARVLLESDKGPLLAAWVEPNRRIVAFAFDIHDSDLPLQPAFPILVQDITQWLLPGTGKGLATQPGGIMEIPILPESNAASVEAPSGHLSRVAPPFPAQPISVEEIGPYQVIYETPEGKKTGYFVANLFDPVESDISPAELPQLEVQSVQEPGTSHFPLEFINWLVLAALVLFVGEWYVYNRGY